MVDAALIAANILSHAHFNFSDNYTLVSTCMADYEKPSKRKRWEERADKPIIDRPMTVADIEEYRRFLVASYDCEQEEIAWEFRRIRDEDIDEDRDDYIWLKYKIRVIEDKKIVMRDIFSIKLPIPESVRATAGEARRRQDAGVATHHRPIRALPAPSGAVITTTPTLGPEDAPPRPRLRTRNAKK